MMTRLCFSGGMFPFRDFGVRAILRQFGDASILLLVVGAAIGCGNRRSDKPPDVDRILAAFDSCRPPSATASGPLPAMEIVIDDSESMRGFVDASNSAYRRLIRKLLEKSVAAGYAVGVEGFADLHHDGRLGNPLSSVLSASFYRRADTPLSALFNQITAANDGKIYIVVSDMVQSETGRDSLALTGAFRKMVGVTPAITLYGFRSAFRGKYFVETPPKSIETVNMIDEGGKPFYMLVLAPSLERLQQFERYAGIGPLTSGSEYGVQMQTFYPSETPIELRGVAFVPPGKSMKSAWNGFNPVDQRCNGGYVQTYAFKEADSPSGKRQELVFSMLANARQPVILPSRYSVEISKANLSSKVSTVVPARTASVEVNGKLGEASAVLTYRFVKPDADTWDLYRIRFRAGAGNLGLPPWVQDWSTSDDHNDPQRTLNLATVIEAMVRSSSENVVFFDHIIELHGGK
jgi:hypothetical protein